MVISIRIRVMPLRNGGYKPEFELIEWNGSHALVQQYLITESFPTEEEAEKNAKHQAIAEVRDKYGENVQVDIAEIKRAAE